MKLAEFNKLRKNCPWHYVGTNWDKSKRCLATDQGPNLMLLRLTGEKIVAKRIVLFFIG